MIYKSRIRKEPPSLNTAALPDLIFTVLFFFMIATHMRNDVPMVVYDIPQGSELTRLTNKATVTYIYIGTPASGGKDASTHIQLNGRFVTADEITDIMTTKRMEMAPDEREMMTVSVKADHNTRMEVINNVRQALREAGVSRICFSAERTTDGKK